MNILDRNKRGKKISHHWRGGGATLLFRDNHNLHFNFADKICKLTKLGAVHCIYLLRIWRWMMMSCCRFSASCLYPMFRAGYLDHTDDIYKPGSSEVLPGSMVKAICDSFGGSNYILLGSSNPTCGIDGSWQPDPFPECYESKCSASVQTIKFVQARFLWRPVKLPCNGLSK